tara:strand:- start:146 stop:865 length:720 start_codon:yes stop_codon:yes gene_type:complete
MEKSKKIKIYIGIFYSILLFSFLFIIFSKFSFEEITSYQFIQINKDKLLDFKEANLIFTIIIFIILTIFWVFLLGFASPIALIGGFIFGKWIGTIVVGIGLSLGATFIYIFGNYFFKDFIKKKFTERFKKLESKFKKNELIYLIIFRLIGGIPFQIANLMPALFNVSVKNYFIGTLFGLLPPLFIMVSLGGGIENILTKNEAAPSLISLLFSKEIYIPILGFIFLLIVTIICRRRFFKN